jgi:hypothetical protein
MESRNRYSDLLLAGRSADRISVGMIFSVPFQDGPRTNPAFYTLGISSFPGVKWPGRGVNHPHPCSAEVKEK